MSEETDSPALHVTTSPHLSDVAFTTRRMMLDVIIALVPAMLVAVWVFRWYAVVQVGLCVLSCMAAEWVFTTMRGKTPQLWDLSAVVTGIIIGFSLPWSAPLYIAVIASVFAIGLGKVVFGGLGFNIFNPAMAGRAFVMLSFSAKMGAPWYQQADATIDVLTRATPLSMVNEVADWRDLILGTVNGSLGEVSVWALVLGGLYLCIRRVASWQIPVSVILTTFILATIAYHAGWKPFDPFYHICSGSLLLGAFFIATDPVTSPLTPKGKWLFGAGIGFFVVLLRVFSSYPEGVMFAILLMNAVVPLINRWTIPTPLGGPVPTRD